MTRHLSVLAGVALSVATIAVGSGPVAASTPAPSPSDTPVTVTPPPRSCGGPLHATIRTRHNGGREFWGNSAAKVVSWGLDCGVAVPEVRKFLRANCGDCARSTAQDGYTIDRSNVVGGRYRQRMTVTLNQGGDQGGYAISFDFSSYLLPE